MPIKMELNKTNFEKAISKKTVKTKKLAIFHIQAPSQKMNHRNAYGINWVDVSNMLENNGYQTVEILTPSENNKPILRNFLFLNLKELFETIERSDIFIGLDSGPAHIAQLYQIKSFLFFGSVLPELRLDLSKFSGYIFQSPCEFSGCYHSIKGTKGAICKIVGEFEEPPCCVHTSNNVIDQIERQIRT